MKARHGTPAVDPAAAWNRFWFRPATAGRLATVRFAAGLLGLLLLRTWSDDLVTWFGDEGMVPPDVLAVWRAGPALAVLDPVSGRVGLSVVLLVGCLLFGCLAAGALTAVTAPLAALFHAALLHRGPMLAGPADDVLAAILWCLVVGRSGDALSVDRLRAARSGGGPGPSWRNRVAEGLLRVHASALAAAAFVSQIKADVWWNGTAARHLAEREASRPGLAGAFAASEYLTNLVTHSIPCFEIAFARAVWPAATRRAAARAGMVGWPLVGLLAGEPAWGAAMGILALACLPGDDD